MDQRRPDLTYRSARPCGTDRDLDVRLLQLPQRLADIKQTAAKYKDAGLITLGVHTPEFDREKVPANVERRVKELGVVFPVVMDNDFAIWRSLNNRYWPSVYIVDKQGRIRFHHDGEGRYDDIDAAVRAFLAE